MDPAQYRPITTATSGGADRRRTRADPQRRSRGLVLRDVTARGGRYHPTPPTGTSPIVRACAPRSVAHPGRDGRADAGARAAGDTGRPRLAPGSPPSASATSRSRSRSRGGSMLRSAVRTPSARHPLSRATRPPCPPRSPSCWMRSTLAVRRARPVRAPGCGVALLVGGARLRTARAARAARSAAARGDPGRGPALGGRRDHRHPGLRGLPLLAQAQRPERRDSM